MVFYLQEIKTTLPRSSKGETARRWAILGCNLLVVTKCGDVYICFM